MNLIPLVFLSIAASVDALNYCHSSLCPDGDRHIACENHGKFDQFCPNGAAMIKFDSDLQDLVTDAHNKKRNIIAGGGDANHDPACRMATMQWDTELANLAELNVRQCEMRHDSCHNTKHFKYSGQNLAEMTYFGVPDNKEMITKAIEMWYGEVRQSNRKLLNPFKAIAIGIGHFSVMVADRNIRLGCGASTYSENGHKVFLLACNYATTNMIDFPIYAACNKAGSKCTMGHNPFYTNLCSVSEPYDVNKWF